MYVCMYIYIYIYTHRYTYTYIVDMNDVVYIILYHDTW